MVQPSQGTREPTDHGPAWIADSTLAKQFDNGLAEIRRAAAGTADKHPPQRLAFDGTSSQPAKNMPDPGHAGETELTPQLYTFLGPLPGSPPPLTVPAAAEAARTAGAALSRGAAMAIRLAPVAGLLLLLKGDTASETVDVPGRADLYGELDGKDLVIFQRGTAHWGGLWHDWKPLAMLGTKTEYAHGILLGQVLDANGQVIGAIEKWHLSLTHEALSALAARARELNAASPEDPDAKPRKPDMAVPQTVVPPEDGSLAPDGRTAEGQSTWRVDKMSGAVLATEPGGIAGNDRKKPEWGFNHQDEKLVGRGEIEGGGEDTGGVVRISLTGACNLRCVNCHNEGQDHPLNYNQKEHGVAIQEIDTLIGALVPHNAGTITFTGGEPGVYKHFFELMEAIPEWKTKYPQIKKWTLTTNGIPFMGERGRAKREALARSGLTNIAVSVDSVEESDNNSRPSSPVGGASGADVFGGMVEPLMKSFPGRIKIDTVFAFDGTDVGLNRTLGVVDRARKLDLDVSVIQVNGTHGVTHNVRAEYDQLKAAIAARCGLQPKLNPEMDELYLHDADGRVVMKFYNSHCDDGRCDICHKVHYRVVPSRNGQGIDAVPCFAQDHTLIPLMEQGKVIDQNLLDSFRLHAQGPKWFMGPDGRGTKYAPSANEVSKFQAKREADYAKLDAMADRIKDKIKRDIVSGRVTFPRSAGKTPPQRDEGGD